MNQINVYQLINVITVLFARDNRGAWLFEATNLWESFPRVFLGH